MIGVEHFVKYQEKSQQSYGGKKFRIAVEGNIASGKSTLLKKLSQINGVEVLIEPVDKWRNLNGGNVIGRMYEDAPRWGFLFQSYVLVTMMELHNKPLTSPICLLERSVFSARYCFVENLHKNKVIDDMEYGCYCHWFDYIMKQNPPHVDLIVYLRTSPDVCFERLQQRGRKEEQPVTRAYLQSLHDRYEEWLSNEKHHSWHGNVPVLVIDGNEDASINSGIHTEHCSNILSKLDITHHQLSLPH
ncbi:hypothetical protein EMCRGX_G017360 [Ephydatia muelleri]